MHASGKPVQEVKVEEWQLTGGVLVRMGMGLDGVMYLWLSENFGTSAVVEWSWLLNRLQVSVVHGDYGCLAEWFKPGRLLEPQAMDKHIQMAVERWQQQYTAVALKASESMKRSYVATMLTNLTDVLDIPA
jgi:hypothetical protein